MRFFKHSTFWVGISYFLILLSIAFWVRDIPDQQNSFNTIQQLINASRLGDPISFAIAAIDIAENGWVSSANEWILNLWPPGFILLEALILKVMGSNVPVILVLQILAAGLFSIILLLLYNLIKTSVNNWLALILPLFIFVFPVSRVFLLQPTGISLGESFAIGFFLLSVLLAFRSNSLSSIRYAVFAGIFLAMSAYFRSQFEIILLALTGWGILLVIAIKYTGLRNFIEPKLAKSVLTTITIMLLVAHITTVPWRTYHWIHQGKPLWVMTSDITFGNSVLSSEYLKQKHGGFVVEGAGTLVCRIDPTTCGDTANAKKLFFKTFVEHPVEWYSIKLNVIGKYWFSSVKNWGTVKFQSTATDTILNGLILFALILLILLLFARNIRSHGLWILLVWFNTSLISAYMLIFSFAHFEVRYFYFPKIAIIFMFIIIGCLYYPALIKDEIKKTN